MKALVEERFKVAVLLKDSYGRAIRDLRVSVTDKCNFRCFYCLPHGSPPETAPKSAVLTYEEIEFATDQEIEELKMRRAKLKDYIYHLVRHAPPSCPACDGTGVARATV